jgi:threonine dehydrogenase-like Zn-dependent dehydrogenase
VTSTERDRVGVASASGTWRVTVDHVKVIPAGQSAVQLIGPGELRLNHDKPVPRLGDTQILGQVECAGLCFSDTKLLREFGLHPRKTPVLAHLPEQVLRDIPSYAPGSSPTVPGHEVVLRVIGIGRAVTSVAPGGRYVVQADFRDLKTEGGNGAFGYNFEGGLQQHVLLDERVTIAASGESYLLPVPEELAASQLALIEPWACVESAFSTSERRGLRPGGTMLVVGAGRLDGLELANSARRLCARRTGAAAEGLTVVDPAALAAQSVDDLLYGGADAAALEGLFPLVANDGLVLIASCGERFGRPVSVPIGRVHYGNIRMAASSSADFAHCLQAIPASSELRDHDHVNVVGAGGPMGVMSMARAIAASKPGALVEGAERNPKRAQALQQRVAPLAARRRVEVRLFSPGTARPRGPVDYCMLMAPVPAFVGQAIEEAAERGIINIFAGLSPQTPCAIDLDGYARKQLYFVGTSGSNMADMRAVLGQVVAGQLDTSLSVGAVSGMAGAIDGLTAVQHRTIAGKIIVYPALSDLPLVELADLAARYPTISALLADGCWTKAAEQELLHIAHAVNGITPPAARTDDIE